MKDQNKYFLKTSVHSTAVFFLILFLTACGAGGGNGTPDTSGANVTNDGGTTGGGTSGASFGTATLSWLPPTENTDGSALTLAGYKIYYGTSADNYTTVVNIDNPGLATYLIDNLPAGNTYYFVITAIDSNGIESAYSEVGSKTISA